MQNSKACSHPAVQYSFKRFWKQLGQYRILLAMLMPTVIYVFIFSYLPMGGAIIAFKRYDYALGILKSPWIGFANFRYLFTSGKVITLFRNTVLYNAAFYVFNLLLELIIAIVISEMSGRFFKKACQTLVFLPYFISMVVLNAITYNLLNYQYGFINNIITALGRERINFYSNAGYWPIILVLLNAWKSIGYGSVVYIASIASIDNELFEAARIDGANIIGKIRYVTLPHLLPTIIILALMSVGSMFRGNFQLFWNVIGQNSMLYKTTDVIDTYVYRSLLQFTDYGMTGATGLLQSVLCFVTIITVNALVKKIDSDSALF